MMKVYDVWFDSGNRTTLVKENIVEVVEAVQTMLELRGKCTLSTIRIEEHGEVTNA